MKIRKVIYIAALVCVACGAAFLIERPSIKDGETIHPAYKNVKNNGRVVYESDKGIAFVFDNSNGDSETCGGYSDHEYSSIIFSDNLLVVYNTYNSTTADNGTTTLYELEITDDWSNELMTYVKNSEWKSVYDTVSTLICDEEHEVVSYGMSDSESRNEDGSYKWKDDYNAYVERLK